jgi:predicted glycosyltransferase
MLLPSLDMLLPEQARYWNREPFLKLKRAEALRFRQSLLESAFNCFKPDALFVDYLPLGKNEELGRLIDEGKFRKYFVMRGVLDHPDEVRVDVMQGRAELALATHYDKIFVACDAKICDVEREYQLHSSIAKKLTYVGYVSEAVSEEAIESARNERGIPAGAKWVVCSAGGGALGESLIKECVRVSKQMSESFFDIIVGPRSSLTWEYKTSEVFGDGRVRMHRECLHLPMLHAACDVAVISGGYNSLVEAMEGRASIIIVPTQVQANDEQCLHAGRLARHVSVRLVQGIQDLYEAVKIAVTEPVRRKSAARSSISLDGAEAIRKILFQDLNIRG